MNLDFAKLAEAIKDKVGRKQLIAIVGMVLLSQMGADSWQVVIVALAGIGSQLAIDWFRPKADKGDVVVPPGE